MKRSLVAIAVLLALGACGADDDDNAGGTTDTVPSVSGSEPPTTPPEEPATTPPAATTPTTPPLSVAPGSQPRPSPPISTPKGTPIDKTMPLVTDAVDDLAERLGISPDEVTVVEALAVTWPDGSLGCPEPGMMYTQVLTDGAFALLEAGGKQYRYHGGTPLFLCEQGA